VLAGMSLVGLLGYVLYGKAMTFAEELPVYASKVASARQGARIAVVCAVAAVVVDYHMPENGHEVATEIRRLKPQIPIVMVSSDDAIPEPH
jgi:DNA-binding NarL/FixJ family response regulator